MKNAVLLLCIAILFRPVLPVLEYAVNYDYIKTMLCINREKPELHCNGKCYLMRKMALAAETERSSDPDKKHAATEIADLFFVEVADQYNFHFPFTSTSNDTFAYINLYKSVSGITLLRPPAITS